MFYFLSKAFLFLINPLCWLIFLFIYMYRTKSGKRKRITLGLSLFIMIIGGNEIILNTVMLQWEPPKQKVENIEAPYDYAIVLAGGQNRAGRAIEMYRKDKVKNICILGSQRYVDFKSQLIILGIPEEHIFIETRSKNTFEHASFFKAFMNEVQPQALDTSTFVLITSALHMRRAKMCFDKQEVSVVPFATNFVSYDPQFNDLQGLLPGPLSLHFWGKLNKECFGIIAYRVMGFI